MNPAADEDRGVHALLRPKSLAMISHMQLSIERSVREAFATPDCKCTVVDT